MLETLTATRDRVASATEIIEEARAGRMFILVDSEERENEGDLVVPAQFATPQVINFMARHARGLICLALTKQRVDHLGLPLMSGSNRTRHRTAFTVSIEAHTGVTTGISAHDRAHTIAVAINPELGREDIVSPGHIFPLVAREGGTLVRAGHTEGSVDISRLAGLNPAGVICEIMNDDGTMARFDDLVAFSRKHDLKLGTIADLIAHRRRTERLVSRCKEAVVADGHGGSWRLVVYRNVIDNVEHLALVKGDLSAPDPILVRMHAAEVVDDLLGRPDMAALHRATDLIREAGRGVVVLIRDGRHTAVSDRIEAMISSQQETHFLRDYGIGAQILVDLGVHEMILLSNTHRTVVGLGGYDLNVVDQRTIDKCAIVPAS
jgi:3,4-dihydroxy 2-butanone 4-phosphate synthase/GTP cyclohydrolase II